MRDLLFEAYRQAAKGLARFGLGRLGAARRVHGWVTASLAQGRVLAGGHVIFLDKYDSLHLAIYGIHEPFQTEFVSSVVKEGDVVVDAGAHIGYYTLIFAKLVGPEGRVFAFEPDPGNFSLLKKNVEANGYQNVVVENRALGDETGKIRLYLSSVHAGDHRTYDVGESRPWVVVDCVRLEDYMRDRDCEVDLVKMDIQGAE
ncbi:MAG: FkbM family methyltransferase, partial [Candidatus Methylomirabilales bacterium]